MTVRKSQQAKRGPATHSVTLSECMSGDEVKVPRCRLSLYRPKTWYWAAASLVICWACRKSMLRSIISYNTWCGRKATDLYHHKPVRTDNSSVRNQDSRCVGQNLAHCMGCQQSLAITVGFSWSGRPPAAAAIRGTQCGDVLYSDVLYMLLDCSTYVEHVTRKSEMRPRGRGG